MESSSFINKQTNINGVTFVTNNFVAVLDHQDLPNDFHIIQDFLAFGLLNFALTQPVKVSFKSVMQVWNTMAFGQECVSGRLLITFEYNGVTHQVTLETVEKALHLPSLDGVSPDTVSIQLCSN